MRLQTVGSEPRSFPPFSEKQNLWRRAGNLRPMKAADPLMGGGGRSSLCLDDVILGGFAPSYLLEDPSDRYDRAD